MNVCDLRRRPLVLTFVFDRGADCLPQVDRTERVRDDAARGGLRHRLLQPTRTATSCGASCEGRGWKQPVAVDGRRRGEHLRRRRLSRPPSSRGAGGRVLETKLGNLTEGEMRAGRERLSG